MKKVFIFSLSVFLISLPFYLQSSVVTSTNNKEEAKDIPLTRETDSMQPRSLNTASVQAFYNEQSLIIQSENYTGEVQVKVTGAGEITATFHLPELGTEFIDISALPEGIYFIKITTASEIYTGVFMR